MGTRRLADSTAYRDPVTEGDKRMLWRPFFATGDLAQRPPQKNRNCWCLEATAPALIKEQWTSTVL